MDSKNLQPYGVDSDPPPFLRMPRFIWEMESLSINAKVIYMLIFDRIRLSAGKKNFTDSDGSVFCYYSDEDLADALKLNSRTVRRAVNELKENGLLDRKRTNTKDGKAITYLSVPVGTDTSVLTNDSLGHECPNLTDTSVLTNRTSVSGPFPYISKNKLSKNKGVRKEPSRAEEAAGKIIHHWNEHYQSKYRSGSKETVKLVKNLLDADYEVDQIIRVIDYRASRRKTQADYKWFVPSTVLALKNFQRSFEWMINDEAMMQGMDAYDGHVV